MDAIGQVVGGPPIGALATRYGLRAAMVAVGLLFAPALRSTAVRLVRMEGRYDRAVNQDADEHDPRLKFHGTRSSHCVGRNMTDPA